MQGPQMAQRHACRERGFRDLPVPGEIQEATSKNNKHNYLKKKIFESV